MILNSLSATSADQSYRNTARSRSFGFTKVNGFHQYGPVQSGVYCSLSRGGSLSYSLPNKQNAETHCETHNCDIITELSNGKFEIGSTTGNKCEMQAYNVKQQWLKDQN